MRPGQSKKAAEGAERRSLEPALEDGAAAHSVDLGPTKSTVLRDTVLEWKGEREWEEPETLYRRERASRGGRATFVPGFKGRRTRGAAAAYLMVSNPASSSSSRKFC